MKTLKVSTGSFDHVNTFNVNVRNPVLREAYPRKCSLHRDYKKKGDGILWIMQHPGCIASSYSQSEIDEMSRLRNSDPIVADEIVKVGRKKFKVRMLGDYSSCAILDPV